MELFQLEPGTFTAEDHNGKSVELTLLKTPEPIAEAYGHYGKIYKAIGKIAKGEEQMMAWKVYGQGEGLSCMRLQDSDRAYLEDSGTLIQEIRDIAFERYKVIRTLTEYTFDWVLRVPETPLFITPFEENTFSLNDFSRVNSCIFSFSGFNKKFVDFIQGLEKGGIQSLENFDEVVEIFKHITTIATHVGVLLQDSYFFQVIERDDDNASISLRPFLGDFDDSFAEKGFDWMRMSREFAQHDLGLNKFEDLDDKTFYLYMSKKEIPLVIDTLLKFLNISHKAYLESAALNSFYKASNAD